MFLPISHHSSINYCEPSLTLTSVFFSQYEDISGLWVDCDFIDIMRKLPSNAYN